MPLIFLMGDTFGKWKAAVNKLDVWNQIVTLEETLLRRARSVFMAHWFGTGLPLHNGDLRIAFANLDELVQRYRALKAGLHLHQGVNLTEPLMGMAGELTGMFAAPIPSVFLLIILGEVLPDWYYKLAAVVNYLTMGILMPIVGLVGGPLVFLLYLPLTKLGPGLRGVPVMTNFLGAAAEFLLAASQLLFQLTGPREDVRNPLLRQMLDLLGQVANLLPFILVLVALIVVYLGPMLSPLAQQLTFMIPLALEIISLVKFAWSDFTANLSALYTGENSPWGIVKTILQSFKNLFSLIKKSFTALFTFGEPTKAKPTPAGACEKPSKDPGNVSEVMEELKAAWAKIRPMVMNATRDHWLIQRLKEISKRFKMLADVWGRLPPAPPTPSTGMKAKIKAAIPPMPAAAKALPTFPTLPAFPDIQDTYDRLLKSGAGALPETPSNLGDLFKLDKSAQAALEKLHQPSGIFSAEQAALEKQTLASLGKTPAQALADLQAQDSQIRTMLFAIVDRYLPASIAEYVPKMQSLLWELEDVIFGEKAQFPVRKILEGELLAPEITRLRIRAPGMQDAEVRQWVKDLRTAITAQPYRTMPKAQEG